MKLPAAQRVELAERLLASVEGFATLEIEAEWRQAVAERVEEYESGKVKGIPAEEVMEHIREQMEERRHGSKNNNL